MVSKASHEQSSDGGQLTDHERWLRAPAEQHLGRYSNAYSEIAARTTAMREMRKSAASMDDNEPNGRRWAREDAATLAHVRESEKDIALRSIAQSMEDNKGYAFTMAMEFPGIAELANGRSHSDHAPDAVSPNTTDLAVHSFARVISGTYVGKVTALSNLHVEQKIGREPSDVMIHDRKALTGDEVAVGNVVTVRYDLGKGQLRNHDLAVEKGGKGR